MPLAFLSLNFHRLRVVVEMSEIKQFKSLHKCRYFHLIYFLNALSFDSLGRLSVPRTEVVGCISICVYTYALFADCKLMTVYHACLFLFHLGPCIRHGRSNNQHFMVEGLQLG